MALRDDLARLDAWGFAFPGLLRDELTALALAGTKTTTAFLLAETEADGEVLPVPGVREVLLDSDEHPVAVIVTVDCRVARLAEVDDRHAIDEGEGYANAAEFRIAHERSWNGDIDDLRRRIRADFAINNDTLVVLQRFTIVERLEPD